MTQPIDLSAGMVPAPAPAPAGGSAPVEESGGIDLSAGMISAPASAPEDAQPQQVPQTEPSGWGEQLKRTVTNPYHALMGEPEKIQPAGRGATGATNELLTGLAGLPNQVYHAALDAPKNEEEANLYNQAHDIGNSLSTIQGIGAGGADVDAHAAVAYKRLVTDGIVESYQKARRLEAMAEKEKNPEHKKALLAAAGVYGTTDFKENSSFRNALTNLLHAYKGSGAGMVPLVGPIVAKTVETGFLGDTEKGDFEADPLKAITSALEMAALPAAQEKAIGLVKGGVKAGVKAGLRVGGDLMDRTIAPVSTAVGETSVPVRNPGAIARVAQKAVPKTSQSLFENQTGPAVAKGIGDLAKDATGATDDVIPTQHDRMGIRGVADDIRGQSQHVFKSLDDISGGMLSDAQQATEDAAGDYSVAGRKAYRQGLADQDAVFEHYKDHAEIEGMDLDTAKKQWRQQAALREVNTKLSGATEASPTGEQPYQFKQGKQLSESIDNLVKNDKDTLQRAGFTDDHIAKLQKFGRIIREQGDIPRFSKFMGGIAKATGGVALAGWGAGHLITGAAAEMLAEKVGGLLTDRILGKTLQTPTALDILSRGFEAGEDAALVSEKLKSAIQKSDPGWAASTAKTIGELANEQYAKMKGTLTDLAKGESGEATVPFTGGAGAGVAEAPKTTVDYEHDSTGKFGNQDHMVTTKDEGGKVIGTLAAQDMGNGTIVERFHNVADEHQGLGYGKAQLEKLFVEAETGGAKFVKSDISTTDADRHVWQSMERKYPNAVTREIKGKGASAKPVWTADLSGIKGAMKAAVGSVDDALAAAANRKRSPLSDEDAQAMSNAHATNGGATFTATGEDQAGKALHSVGGSYPGAMTIEGKVATPDDIHKFIAQLPSESQRALKRTDVAIGTWADPATGKTTMELTNLVKSRAKAIQLGKDNNQIAIFDLKKGESIETGGTGVAKANVTTQESAPQPILSAEDYSPGQRVSQRNPTGVKATEDPMSGNLQVGFDAIKATDKNSPGVMRDMAVNISKYSGSPITEAEALANPEAALTKFVDHVAKNLEWLHNQIPADIRNISKLWYDSAHTLTKSIAEKYGVAHEQVAGIVAALSPKNEWNNNVELTKRFVDTYHTKQGFKWSTEMNSKAAEIAATNPKIVKLLDALRGKTLGELVEHDEKAAWIRLYDEAHNHSAKASYAPDGSVRDFARNTDQSISASAWNTGLGPMVKAVKILEDGSLKNIHTQLGEAHKIRNFYNNIIDPRSKMGDVTIDTHAVGAGLLQPVSQKSEPVLHNFGSSYNPAAKGAIGGVEATPSAGSTITGVSGTYGLYADAYRLAAKRLGILPRELQSITWEGIRSLFPGSEKNPTLTKAINQVWKDYKDGDPVTGQRVSIERARKQIVKAAKGFKDPPWLADIKASQAAAKAAETPPKPLK